MRTSDAADATASTAATLRRRVAVVVQRYGDGILGGAEAHARMFVDAVRPHHDLTVLTSCANDGATWAMHYTPGADEVGGVPLLRFAHPVRNVDGRARVPRRHKLRFLSRRGIDLLGAMRVPLPVGDDDADGHLFLRRQGPCCLGLVDHLRDAADLYDAVVFFTALYHPTAEGLPAWGRRSVLIPTLHDEKAMYLPWFHRVFATAGETLYNTAAEQRLARRLYGDSAAAGQVVGAAVSMQQPTPEQVVAMRQRHGIPERYLVYVGRIEKGKGCGELLAAWRAVAAQAGDAALVFVGRGGMPLGDAPRVVCTGFVAEAERDALISGAAALVMPSRLESLSLVLLEALAQQVPALVNARCEVLADQIRDSGAGVAYRGGQGLQRGLIEALARSPEDRARLGAAGRRHVALHYARENVQAQWLGAIARAASMTAPAVVAAS